MKIDWNKKYTTISLYAVIVFLICYLFYKFTNTWDTTLENLQGLIKILAPFIYALAIAYFISPLVNFIEDKLFGLLNHHRLKRGLSILVTYIIIFSTAVLLLSFVLPQLISSIQEIALLSGKYMPQIEALLANEHIEIFDSGYYLDLTLINQYLNENVIDAFTSVSGFVTDIAPILIEYVTRLTSGLLNIFLGFIIAIYLLVSKESGLMHARKLVFALFPPKPAINLINLSKESNRIFINFIIGKIVDSIIIGIICFIILIIFNYPYAFLLSIIVGITNIIPISDPLSAASSGLPSCCSSILSRPYGTC